MSVEINWLLLSDLHLGIDCNNWLWPKVKYDIFKDIKKLEEQVGNFDLVFFTGDFVQSGKNEEYDYLNKELDELWNVFSKSGKIPLLCPVPGNHDIARPSQITSVLNALTKHWWSDDEFRKTFWSDENSEGRIAINEYFANYTSWLSKLSVPIIKQMPGAIPGDYSATFSKQSCSLGLIGLNSTFLQLTSGDYKGKLDLHISQLNAVCEGDVSKWIKARTASLLLTHHPPSWLAPEALEHYRGEIYPPERFISHMCGHLHEPETIEIREGGGHQRRFRQGPSLFGLEEWQDPKPSKRLHGYLAGQYVIDGAHSIEKIWPRTAIKGRDGTLNICPDHTFKLLENNNFEALFEIDYDSEEHTEEIASTQEHIETPKYISDFTNNDLHLLDKDSISEDAIKLLSSCQRFTFGIFPHHLSVRQEEQSQFELEIRKNRIVWLTADWGTGKEGFIAASLNRFSNTKSRIETFHLLCDDADDENSFQSLFPKQFGMSLQAFCRCVSSLSSSFLILDGIQNSMCERNNFYKLKQIASAVLDYCPQLNLVFISRIKPTSNDITTIELRPLDQPDVRTYVLNHPDTSAGLCESDIIEKLHERSDGLPMNIDRIIKSIQVSSLESVLDAEMEGSMGLYDFSENVPKALIHAITSLSKSNDKTSQRSFLLLKVLAILPYGETLETLGHFLSSKPFFINNALELKDLALLEVIPLKHSSPSVEIGKGVMSEENSPKILKVPRQVGQYVQTLLSESERSEIVLAGVERFFGRQWREGKVKLRKLPFEYKEYLSSGVGNEFAVVHHLIADAKRDENIQMVSKAIMLGIQYCNHLLNEQRYRDLGDVAGGLLLTINREEMPNQWCELAALNGKAFRMISKHNEAIINLYGALDAGKDYLNKNQQASIWVEIALAEVQLNHSDLAISASEEVMKLIRPGSRQHINALSIIASQTLKGEDKINRLKELEKEARKGRYTTLANNITLDLADDKNNPEEEIQLLDKVLESDIRGYTKIRAIVSKARAIDKINGTHSVLSNSDIALLSSAYTYLYSQRLGILFDRCHAALWNLFEKRGDTTQLMRIFRHSSFVWRIRGSEEEEVDYITRLSIKVPVDLINQTNNSLSQENNYFLKRLSLVIKSK